MTACAASRKRDQGPAPSAHAPSIRFGPDRSSAFPYQEPFAEAKAALLRRINWERRAAGSRELKYDLRGAKVGDDFCAESIANGTAGHWDLAGRSPYLRWALAGGVDFHAQNFASRSISPGPLREPIEKLLLESHALMMAEVPPDDGHKRAVLDPSWTHVGIGAALSGGEFRMTEEFSRQELEWVEIPARPVARGSTAYFSGKLPSGWQLLSAEIAYEKVPRPMSRREISALNAYNYPRAFRKLRAKLGNVMKYQEGGSGEIEVSPAGIFRVPVETTEGAGHYYVLVYAGAGNLYGRLLSPSTGALIQAE